MKIAVGIFCAGILLGQGTICANAADHPAKQETAKDALLSETNVVLEFDGRVRRAIRFIYPPVFTLLPPKDAVHYQAQFSDAKGNKIETSATIPSIDMSGIWSKIAPGRFTGKICALDKDGRTIAQLKKEWHKARQFPGNAAPIPQKLNDVVEGVAKFLLNYRNPKAYEPDRPPLLWHAAVQDKGELHDFVYPAWGHALMAEFFLHYAAWDQVSEQQKEEAQKLARSLLDDLSKHRTVDGCPYANLYYSSATRGKHGGGSEGETITPTMSGHAGRALLMFGLEFKDQSFIRAAWQTALSLVRVQHEDGSFPFRVNPQTGAVRQLYTSNIMPVVLFWDALLASPADSGVSEDTASARDAISAARKRALAWMMNGPWKDYRWEGMYEDVEELPAYENLQWFDASMAVSYVLARPEEFPSQREQALAITRWIEDQFLCWHDDDVHREASRIPYTPAALEQYRCYSPIDAHAARAIDLFLSVWRATGDESYRMRACALAGSLAGSQRSNGAIPTWWWLNHVPASGEAPKEKFILHSDWFRCMAYDADILLAHLKELSAQ